MERRWHMFMDTHIVSDDADIIRCLVGRECLLEELERRILWVSAFIMQKIAGNADTRAHRR